MTISLWIHGYDKTKKNPQHDQILNSYINIKNISTTGISVSRIVYKKDIDFFLCIFAVNSYSLLKHLISLKKLPFASNALLDKHPCHFRTSEPELGTRQFCRDNGTMFSGHKVVCICHFTIFVVATPSRH